MHRPLLKRLLAVALAGTIFTSSAAFAKTEEITKADSFSGAYLAGRVADHNGDLNIAIDYFKQALAYNPNSQQLQQDMFITLLSNGNFKEAVALAKKIKGKSDVARFIDITLAANAFINKDYTKVSEILNFQDPSFMDKLSTELIKAWAKFGRGDHKAAISDVNAIMGPAWYDLFLSYHLALMNDLDGNKQEATRYYNQALNDQQGGAGAPDTYERVIFSYASFQMRNNDRNGALKTLRDGEIILSGRDAIKNIREKVEKGAKIDSLVRTPQEGAGEVLYDLGTAINRAGAEAFARAFLQVSLALRPQNDVTIFQLAGISAKQQQYEQTAKLYSEISPKSPYFRDAELRVALNLQDAKKSNEAIKHLIALEKENPDDRRISMALAGVYVQEKQFSSAVGVMNRAISYIKTPQKQDWVMFYHRAIALESAKDWDKAKPDFRKALELYPNQPQVLNYLGYSMIDRNENLNEALNMVQKAVYLQPDDAAIIDSLGWAYYKLGRYDEAVKTLQKAVKLNPGDANINDHLGDAYWQIGRKLDATFQWNHAIAGKPDAKELAEIEKKLKSGLDTPKITPENTQK